ncbi:uncharacterized protein LOC112155643 isoform X2 [Oryzias melastigma]|uniref:uncharacterized protein LOC112155643 isoform X2 n=1 Tax=Oryzias melastigma TaxID=30732 RepID=UPI000CF7C038|nr:uncharacterized protein LOC112155643 isoform X2 [Oryzias melastigma]
MSVMLSSSALLSRLFVSVLIHAAAMSFIMTSQAAGVGFTPLSAHDALEPSVARRLNHPNSHHRFLSTGLLSPKIGIHAGSRSETGAEGTYADKLSTFKHQPPLVQYAQSSSYGSYSKNVRDNGQQQVGTTQTRTSGMMPASSIFTARSLLGGQSFERPKEEDQTRQTHIRNPNSSYFVVKRVSLLNKTLSFPQTGKYKPSKDGSLTSDPSNVNEVPSFRPLLFPPPTNEVRSAPPSPTRVLYKGYKDTNELPVGESPGFFNPRTPLPRNPLEVRRNPGQEKTVSGPSFSKTLDPMSNRWMQGHKKIILYPSKDSTLKDGEGGWVSMPKQSPFSTPWYGRFNPNLEPPNRMDQSNRQGSTEHDATFYVPAQSPSKTSLVQNVVPRLHPNTQANYAKNTAPQVNSTESTQDYKPGPKRLQRIRGFANPLRQPAKEPSSPTRRTSQMFSLPAIKTRPFLLQKYSFGSGAPSSMTPSKPEQVDGSSLSPGELNVTNLTTDPTSRSTPIESRNWPSKSDLSLDRNPNQVRRRLYKGKFGLQGFGTRPLEGDKALVKSPDVTAPYRSGLKLKSLDFWQPDVIKIIGRYNQTSPSKERQSDDYFKSPPEVKGSVATNEGKDGRTHRKLGIPFSQIASSAHLRSEEHLRAAATPPSGADGGKKPLRSFTSSTARGRPVRLKTNKKTNGSIFINASRNAPIYRLPKTPARAKAVTYNDIPGSASFSSVRATGVIVPSPNNTRFINQTEHQEAKAENKTEDSQAVADTKLDDEVNDIKMPELFLRSGGSKGFNVSEVLSAVERHQDARENLLELDYLQTSTGNIFFKSLKPPSPGKQ